jgi:predicted RNA polymerase sigma factor
MVTLNRIVALAMVHGPATALTELDQACASGADSTLAAHYRVDAVRAHLLDLLGEHTAARDHYRRAARRTLNLPERDYLLSRATAER